MEWTARGQTQQRVEIGPLERHFITPSAAARRSPDRVRPAPVGIWIVRRMVKASQSGRKVKSARPMARISASGGPFLARDAGKGDRHQIWRRWRRSRLAGYVDYPNLVAVTFSNDTALSLQAADGIRALRDADRGLRRAFRRRHAVGREEVVVLRLGEPDHQQFLFLPAGGVLGEEVVAQAR